MASVTHPSAKTAEIRARLDHPIVDVDGHQLEVIPVLLEFLREIGGPGMPDRFLEYFAWVRRTFSMTPEQRADTRSAMPVWWPMPTENTIDRATTVLPGLLYNRMDEIGLDFSIVYPGTGLLVVTLPGMADDELRRAAARAFNLYNAEMFRGLEDRLTPAAVIPMHTPEEAIEELELRDRHTRTQGRGVRGRRAASRPGRSAREHPELARPGALPGLLRHRQPLRLRPGVAASASSCGVAPTFHSGPIGCGSRASISRHQYNQLGGFAEGGEALAKSLFFGGVTVPLPRPARFGFLEGGVAWAQGALLPHARALEEAQRRGDQDPRPRARSTRTTSGADRQLRSRAGARPTATASSTDSSVGRPPRGARRLARVRARSRPEDVHDRSCRTFYFGCEGDDRLNADCVRHAGQPVRRTPERDVRLRHRPLRRRGHAPRSSRRSTSSSRTGCSPRPTSATSRSTTRCACTAA